MIDTMLETLGGMLNKAKTVALIAHVSPDMDALGASLGAMFLLRQGFPALERVDVYCQDKVPAAYDFMKETAMVRLPDEAKQTYDLCIAVDVASYDRLGSCAAIYDQAKERFVIDHHASNNFENVPRLLEADSAASAQIVIELYGYFGVPICKEAAMCLYAGLSTDTGNFSFSSATPETFRAAALLVEAGASPEWITSNLYRTRSTGSVRSLGRALEHLRLTKDGRVAIMHLSLQDRLETGAQDGDYEGIVNYGIEMDGVVAAALVTERKDGIRCSVRTKEGINAAAIAVSFGGGGHARAAGMSLGNGDFAGAVERVRQALEQAVDNA